MTQSDRYHRQTLLPQIGNAGQSRLEAARVLLVGCGALGSVMAEQLARAGVGFLRLVDRDVVELSNLQRQVLYTEADANEGLPKAVAAARRLRQINSHIALEPIVADLHSTNAESLAANEEGWVDLIVDGTDNVETRYLLNDVAVKNRIPWIYGGSVGVEGRLMVVRPETACLRCVFPDPPRGSELPTCDTAGVLGPVPAVIGSLQALQAIKLLSGNETAVRQELLQWDAWSGRMHQVALVGARRPDCMACGLRRFEFLDRAPGDAASLCGRDAVQVRPSTHAPLDLPSIAERLRSVGAVEQSAHLVRCKLESPENVSLTLFPDARAIIFGTSSLERARSIYARYVGS